MTLLHDTISADGRKGGAGEILSIRGGRPLNGRVEVKGVEPGATLLFSAEP